MDEQAPTESREPKRLPLLLRRAWYGLNQAFRRRIAHLGATPDQFTVLRTLSEHGTSGLTQRELTNRMSSDPNTIASLLERMEAAGWLERTPHEKDRRAKLIRLKPAGKKKFHELRRIAVALQTEMLARLQESKREQFLDDLATIAEACRQAAEKSPEGPVDAGDEEG
jgi:DNA-binding MarR family transcriptional regulator